MPELGLFANQFDEFKGARAVAIEKMLDHVDVQPRFFSQCVAAIPMSAVTGGADERRCVGTAVGDFLFEAARCYVDNVLGHNSVGGVFATGDGDQSRDGLTDGVLAGELAGRVALSLEEWSQTGVDTFDIVGAKWLCENAIEPFEQIVDVALARGRVGEIEIPVGIGRAEDPVIVPGNDEETLFSVRRINPESPWIRSRGTTRWIPFEART